MRTGVLAVVAFAAAYVLNQYRGLPLALVIFLVVLVITDFVLRRTTYGRKVFAVGGSVEAARRAGINVAMIRISVFAIVRRLRGDRRSVLRRPRSGAADQGAGGGNLLMQPSRRPSSAAPASSAAAAAPGPRCSACWSSSPSSTGLDLLGIAHARSST